MSSLARTILAAAILLPTALATGQTTSSAPALSKAEELELRTLTGQLADLQRTQKTKVEAASLLLTRSYPQAMDALRDFLSDNANRPAQVAIADAIVAVGAPREALTEPLMALLFSDDAAVRASAARALVAYRNQQVTERLLNLARDGRTDKAIRSAIVAALPALLDRQVIDALVNLLDEGDAAMRDAAAASLARLTSIRHFGNDAAQWKAWWSSNKDRGEAAWLSDLAATLADSKAALESENSRLRERLGKASTDLYEATAANQRDALLAGWLKEPLPLMRLAALSIIDRRLQRNEALAPELKAQVRAAIADGDGAVRQAAVLLTAAAGDAEAIAALLEAMKTEEVTPVRAALLTALGQLRDPQALPVVLTEIQNTRYDSLAAAAATAVGRIASKAPLSAEQAADASRTLVARFEAAGRSGDGAALREAILTALSVVGGKQAIAVLQAALKDNAATVRQAAVNGLAKAADASSADSVAAMLGDSDRGVRQAAIAALGAMESDRHVEALLKRTEPAAESDPGVRQQAWESVLAMLAKAPPERLAVVLKTIADRQDCADQRIKLMQMRLAAMKAGKADGLPAVQRELAAAMVKASRPLEAAALLAEAWGAMEPAGADAAATWNEWVDALLACGDAGVVKVLVAQQDAAQCAGACDRFVTRVCELTEQGKGELAASLCEEALRQLAERLSPEQRAALEKAMQDARGKSAASDRPRVAPTTTAAWRIDA
jgi:HEAT repeat protein